MDKGITKVLLSGAVIIFGLVMIGFAIVGMNNSNGSTTSSTSSAETASGSTSSTSASTTSGSSSTTSTTSTSITASQLTSHSSSSDCWIVINSKVYDVSSYSHPKVDPFTCGADNTRGWESERKHSDSLLSLVKYIGTYSG